MTEITEEPRPEKLRLIMAGLATARAAWPRFIAELAADRLIYIVAAIYIVVANIVAVAVPGQHEITYFLYATVWTQVGATAILIFILIRTLPGILRQRPDHPLTLLAAHACRYATPRTFAGLMLVALQVVVIGTFTSMKNLMPQMAGYTWDESLAHIDMALFGGHDPWTFVTPLISRLHLLGPVEFLYVTGWMLALALVPATVALTPSLKPIRVRFFLTYILTWALLGNLLAVLFMSAGPAYFGDVTSDTTRFQPLVDLLAVNSGSVWSAYDIQRALWAVYERHLISFGTGISAFPSLHIAMVTLWAIVGFQKNRMVGSVGLALLAFFEASSVALGWHYAIDGLVSMVLVVLIWTAVGWALDRFTARAAESAPAW